MDEGTHLWLPPLALAGCLRAVIVRDTRGRSLSGTDLENYFPVSPLVTLYVMLHGGGEWLPTPGFSVPQCDLQQPVMLAGPFTRPTHSRAFGDVHVLHLSFLSDAFWALTGIEPARLANRVSPADGLLPPDWQHWAASLPQELDDVARMRSAVAFLSPRWQQAGPQRARVERYADWTDALLMRAATTSAGRSLRQVERRVKGWAGLPMRELRAVSRGEQAFLDMAAQEHRPDFSWADIAAGADYADQSHLCRETRRLTGFSPEDLRQRIQNEEAFWLYRLWR